MIKVYYTNCLKGLNDFSFFKYLDEFPIGLKKQLLKLKNRKTAHASLTGKLLLKAGLVDFGVALNLFELKFSKYGKPYFECDVHFNIAHSYPHVICAFSTDGVIGIDIEEIRPVCIKDFKKIFLEDEWQRINHSKDIYREFFYHWTSKEAIIKADGRGLQIPLKKIHINNGVGVINELIFNYRTVPLGDDNLISHIASDKDIQEIYLKEIDFSKMSGS